MKKYLALSFVVLVLFSGCTITIADNSGNEIEKSGIISTTELWDDTTTTYVVTSWLTISGNVTWKKGITVIAEDEIYVDGNGSLTIEEGVIVKFDAGAYLRVAVSGSGTLIADGTSMRPIKFTSNSGVSYWGAANTGGILLHERTTTVSRLRYCIVEYAPIGIEIEDAYVAIDSCTVRNNQEYGIHFDGTARPDTSYRTFRGNFIYGNGGYPIAIEPAQAGYICSGNTFTGNASGKDAIYFDEWDMIENKVVVLKDHGVPFVVSEEILLENNSSLTIMPGCEFKMNQGSYFQVGNSSNATFIANGTSADSIRFTTLSLGSKWGYGFSEATSSGGIWIGDYANSNTSLTYAVIENATTGVYIDASVNINRCRISGSKYYGINTDMSIPAPSIGMTYSGNASGNTTTH